MSILRSLCLFGSSIAAGCAFATSALLVLDPAAPTNNDAGMTELLRLLTLRREFERVEAVVVPLGVPIGQDESDVDAVTSEEVAE